jgi:hypothetical protein
MSDGAVNFSTPDPADCITQALPSAALIACVAADAPGFVLIHPPMATATITDNNPEIKVRVKSIGVNPVELRCLFYITARLPHHYSSHPTCAKFAQCTPRRRSVAKMNSAGQSLCFLQFVPRIIFKD